MKELLLFVQSIILIIAMNFAEDRLIAIVFLCSICIFMTATLFDKEDEKWDSKK